MSKTLRETDYLRLLMIYFACFDLNRKDKDTLLKSVDNESHRFVLENIEYLDPELLSDGKKFRRRREEMSTESFNEFNRKLSSSDYEILRTEPRICTLIKQVHDGSIDTKKFPLVVEKASGKKGSKDSAASRRKGAASVGSEFDRQDVLENPRIFVFIIGGISHHEIVSLANL
jgi:Sec1 family